MENIKILLNENNNIIVRINDKIYAFSFTSCLFTYEIKNELLIEYSNISNYSRTSKRHYNYDVEYLKLTYSINKHIQIA